MAVDDGYRLGIDLGTTYTAAAVGRGGTVEVVGLGNRSTAVPSVIHVAADGTQLVGEAADRRGPSEPDRVAREFKRRVGDPTPLLLGGAPFSAEALTARLLCWTIDKVTELEGGPPRQLAVTHPANWGPYKQDLLAQSVRLADASADLTLTEPEAAAIAYAANERIDRGSLVAVYDLGGGTFDAAVLRKTAAGFDILGQPEGIERLGGIDFDEAVLGHVRTALGDALDDLDLDDPTTVAALTRLRRECIDAKEALSSDTQVSIPVVLPGVQTEVRLTRAEFEQMVRPTLTATVDALRRALSSADVAADDVTSVLLVGGSSRIPLVSELVSDAFGRPVAVDAHPKHAIALGAAHALTAGASEQARSRQAGALDTPAVASRGAAAATAAAAARGDAGRHADVTATSGSELAAAAAAPGGGSDAERAGHTEVLSTDDATRVIRSSPRSGDERWRHTGRSGAATPTRDAVDDRPSWAAATAPGGGSRRLWVVAAAVVLVGALAVSASALIGGDRSPEPAGDTINEAAPDDTSDGVVVPADRLPGDADGGADDDAGDRAHEPAGGGGGQGGGTDHDDPGGGGAPEPTAPPTDPPTEPTEPPTEPTDPPTEAPTAGDSDGGDGTPADGSGDGPDEGGDVDEGADGDTADPGSGTGGGFDGGAPAEDTGTAPDEGTPSGEGGAGDETASSGGSTSDGASTPDDGTSSFDDDASTADDAPPGDGQPDGGTGSGAG